MTHSPQAHDTPMLTHMVVVTPEIHSIYSKVICHSSCTALGREWSVINLCIKQKRPIQDAVYVCMYIYVYNNKEKRGYELDNGKGMGDG